jgi:hypothetical protein
MNLVVLHTHYDLTQAPNVCIMIVLLSGNPLPRNRLSLIRG